MPPAEPGWPRKKLKEERTRDTIAQEQTDTQPRYWAPGTTMPDLFRALPSELRLLVLQWLDLPSLYCAIRTSLSFAQTFNTYTAPIIESSIRHYPHDIQRCIRIILTLSKLPQDFISLEIFSLFHLQREASDEPLVNLFPSKGHGILEKAWQIHWIAQYSLNEFLNLAEHTRACIKPGEPCPPLPASWIEEQRFLRAWWRFQVWIDIVNAKSNFAPDQTDRMSPIRLWEFLPGGQIEELLTVMQYDILRDKDQPDWRLAGITEYTGLRKTSGQKCFFFTEDIVQSTWPTRCPSKGPEAFFYAQDETHLQFPSPGYMTRRSLYASRLVSQIWGPHQLHMGLFIWDKRRMARLGFVDRGHHHRNHRLFPDAIEALDPASLAGAWETFERAGIRGLVSWYLEDPGPDLDPE